jgi:hypothetical protein
MAKRKGKAVSFDAMVKFFMRNYNIPTKNDLNRLMAKVDHLEQVIIKTMNDTGKSRRIPKSKSGRTASDTVCEVVGRFKQGVNFAEIQSRTGFEEKKLRNIIFRLTKMGKIARKARGVYISA